MKKKKDEPIVMSAQMKSFGALLVLVVLLVALAGQQTAAFPSINIFKHRYPLYGGGFGGYGGYGGVTLGKGYGWGR